MKHYMAIFFTILLLFFCTSEVKAKETDELMKELDFSDISSFLEEKEDMPVSFEEVLEALLKGGEIPYEKLGDYLKDLILSGFRQNKELMLKILVISLAYSLLKNYAKSFSNSYVAEICFFLCYCYLMILLLQSFAAINKTVLDTTENMAGFMKVLIPTYCTAISLSLNLNTSAAVYSVIFVAIYLVEWLIRYLLVPMVQIYIMLEFLNYLLDEARFQKISKFISDTVRLLLKAAVSFVLGINIIQGLIAPAMDQLAGNTVVKTMQMMPGIGNVMSGMGQIFLSSAVVIKNCVGVAALLILLLLCAVPFFKMAILAVLYKFLAAAIEPIADKRISGGMNGIANGGMLYLKILSTSLMLFLLTIALSTAAG